MAHFAQLDSNNVVTNVIVVDNSDIVDGNGNDGKYIEMREITVMIVSIYRNLWSYRKYIISMVAPTTPLSPS